MADPFARMTESLTQRLGVEAVLGVQIFKTILEHGVAITGEYGEVTSYRDVASIPKWIGAKINDEITIGGIDYKLDSILNNDGYFVRFTLR